MKKFSLLIAFAISIVNVMAQSIGDYRTTATATSLSLATGWETYDGANWVAATYAPAGNTLVIKAPSTWTIGQNTVTMNAPNSLVRVGQSVTSTGNIPGGTTITAINGNVLTLSNATIAGTGGTLSMFESTSATITASSGATTLVPSSANLAVAPGMYVTGTGIAANTTVTAVSADGLSYTISPAASGAVSGSISFYTPATTIGSATSGTTSFTLVSANALIIPGMTIYATGIPSGAKVISVSGTTVNISMPITSTNSKIGAVFGYLVIPNMTINNTVSTATNSRASSIGNVVVNNGGSLTIGIASTTGNDFICNTMTINSGGNLGTTNYTGTAQTNTIEINGGENGTCFSNNGTVDLTTATGGNSVTNISFTIPGNSVLSGSGTTTFNKLTMNMCGVQANTLDVQSVFTMLTATSAPTLTLTSGTLKISSASTITAFGGNGSSSLNAIPTLAGLYLNNAAATLNWGNTVTDGSGMQVRGMLTLTAGTLYLKGRYDANGVGTTLINGGTLEVPAGITVSSSTAALFHVGGAHNFFMTGGNLNLKSHNGGGYANPDYYNISTIQSVTGGTITFSDAAAMNSNASKFYNLTIQNGGGTGTTLTRGSSASTILNNLTVGAGSTLENGTLNITASFAINGNMTSGSPTVALQSSGCVVAGQYLQGTGIPANTTVTGITQTTTTGTLTNSSTTITNVPSIAGITVGNLIFGNGITAGTTITTITGTSAPYSLTLSAATSSSSANSNVMLVINPVMTMSNNATANGNASQIVFYNATAFTNSGSGTINIQSSSNPAYPANTTWSSTINLNSSGSAQNLLTGTYNNVILNCANGANMQNGGTNLITGVAYTGASTINGTLTLTNGTLITNAKWLTIAGAAPTRNTGTITATSGALTFSNASPITLASGLFTGNTIGASFSVNGAGGLLLSNPLTLNAALTLSNGKISLGANDLTIGATGSISGGSSSSYIVTDGSGKLNLPVAVTTNVLIPIGASATSYDPVTVNAATATTFAAKVSQTLSGTAAYGVKYNPYEWTLTPGTGSNTTISLTPSLLDDKVSLNNSNPVVGIYNIPAYSNYNTPSISFANGSYSGSFDLSTIPSPVVLVTGANIDVTAIGQTINDIKLCAKNGILQINGLAINDVVRLYNLNGTLLKNYTVNTNLSEVQVNKGIYIIKIISNNRESVNKLIVD